MENEKENQSQNTEELIKENLRLTREIHAMTRKIKNYVILQRIFSMAYFLLIVIPLVLGIIYLPPLIKNIINPYQEFLNENKSGINLENLKELNDALRQRQ